MSALTVLQNNTSLNPAGTARMDLQPGDRVIVRRIADPTIVAATAAAAFDRPRLRFTRKYGEPVQAVTRGAVDTTTSVGGAASPWIVEMDLEQGYEIIAPDFCAVEVYYPGSATSFRGAYQFAVLPPPATEYYESVSVRAAPREYILTQRIESAVAITQPFLSPSFTAIAGTAGGPMTATWSFGGGLSEGPWAISAGSPIYWYGANSIVIRNAAGSAILLKHTVLF